MTRVWFMSRLSPRINQDMPKVNSDTDWKPRPSHRQLSSDVISRPHHNSHWEKIWASQRLKYSELLIWIIKGKCDIFISASIVCVILVTGIHLATHLKWMTRPHVSGDTLHQAPIGQNVPPCPLIGPWLPCWHKFQVTRALCQCSHLQTLSLPAKQEWTYKKNNI